MKPATDIIELVNLVCALEYKKKIKSYSFRRCSVTRNHGDKCSYVSAGLAAYPVTFSVNTSYDSGSLKRNKSLRWLSFVASFDLFLILWWRHHKEPGRDARRHVTLNGVRQVSDSNYIQYKHIHICTYSMYFKNKQTKKGYTGAMVIPIFFKVSFTFLPKPYIL